MDQCSKNAQKKLNAMIDDKIYRHFFWHKEMDDILIEKIVETHGTIFKYCYQIFENDNL